MARSILLRRANAIFHHDAAPKQPLRREALGRLPALSAGYLLIEDGRIAAYGPDAEAPERADLIIDAQDRLVLPCWCDSHTHIVYAASREGEFIDRLHGLTYEEIAERGGGILNSARKLQEASEDALYEQAFHRLHEVIRFGTGAIEIKSGYGLTVESELKMLRVIRRLRETTPIPVRATFLGAHAIPKAYKSDRQGYLNLIKQEMLPRIHDQGLADYIDVFCDQGFFTPEETADLLEAGDRYGLKAKIHVNELANSGGVQVGVTHNALSVDHLERIGEDEIGLLSTSKTIGTLLPSCAFFLNIPYAPGRALIDTGAAVALATDYNPGSTPSGKMSLVLSLACIKMRLTPEEAVNAATLNGAFAMELDEDYGSITVGKRAHLIVTRPVPSLAFLPYAFGSDHIAKVVLGNEVIDVTG